MRKGPRASDVLRGGPLRNPARAARAREGVLLSKPGSATEWHDYGQLMQAQKRFDVAAACYLRAAQFKPGNTKFLRARIGALSSAGRYSDAIELREGLSHQTVFDRAAQAEDLRSLGKLDEAIGLINKMEAEGELGAESRVVRGISLLMLGDYQQGFADLEARFETPLVSIPKIEDLPRWDGFGTEGRLLIYPDQGLGDEIMFLRFLEVLRKTGIDATIFSPKPLIRLLQESIPDFPIVGDGVKQDAFDIWVPTCSLPHVLSWTELPDPISLAVPAEALTRGRRIVEPFAGALKVGVAWSGNPSFKKNHIRSIRPDQLIPIAEVPGVQLFSLMKGDAVMQLDETGMGGLIHDVSSDDADLADTLGLIASLDLVISTDTSIVHLAASYGKPVWNLLPYESFWQYGLTGETTAWYPTMRLFRQPTTGDWKTPIAEAATALADFSVG